jgi:hypothetical protein
MLTTLFSPKPINRMLDSLIDLAKDHLSGVVNNQPELQNRDPQETARITGETVLEDLMGQAQTGNTSGIMEMLSGQQTSATSPLVSGMIPGIAAKLAGRLGISEGTARTLAAAAIPLIMNMMNGQVNQAQKGGLDIGSMIGGLMGGGGLSGLDGLGNLGGLGGKPKGNQQQGGLGDMLGGFFK